MSGLGWYDIGGWRDYLDGHEAKMAKGDADGILVGQRPEEAKAMASRGTRANPFHSSANLTAGPMSVGLITGFRS